MPTNDKTLIAQFDAENVVPAHIEKWLDMCAKDRKYVNDECVRKPGGPRYAVTTNHILINQRVVTASIYARDPAMRFEPLPQMWGTQQVPDLMTGAVSEVEMGPPPEMVAFARTLDIANAWTLRENDFKAMFTGVLQDIQTNNLMWIKLIPQEEYSKDPLGQSRLDDMTSNLALLRSLKERDAAGDLDPDCADYVRMRDLEATVKEYLIEQLKTAVTEMPLELPPPEPGMPPTQDPRIVAMQSMEAGGEVPLHMLPEALSYVGVAYDVFYPEDVLLDWSMFRPEDWHRGKHVTFRLRKSKEEIAAKYQLTEEEVSKLSNSGSKSSTGTSTTSATDPDEAHTTTNTTVADHFTIYERYDRTTSRRYVWVNGIDRFLANDVVRVTTPWFFPALPITKNRVTGRIVGPSDVTLQRPLQDEINEQRSHARKIKRACIPKTIIGKNMLEKGEKEKLENGDGYSVVELKNPTAVKDQIASTTPPQINPWLTDASEAKYELQKVSGVSNTSAGVVGDANLATEVADARASLDALTEFYRSTLVDWTFEKLGYATAWMLAQIWTEEHAKAVCGPGAVWMDSATRGQFMRQMQLKVEPGSSGRPGGEAFLKKAMMIVDVARGLGLQAKSPQVLSDIVRESGLNIDVGRYFQLAPAPLPPIGKVGTSQGEGGGAPPMAGSPTPDMAAIPNGPAAG